LTRDTGDAVSAAAQVTLAETEAALDTDELGAPRPPTGRRSG
jgi:hypothetical protein